MKATAVIGGSFGSEGKGAVVAAIAGEYDAHVRTGGPNAGHTYYHAGSVWKAQMLPVGWINREATVYLGAGAVVSPEVLLAEVDEATDVDATLPSRVVVDGSAAILDRRHHEAEGGTGGELHKRIGSTGEGVGACRHARMHRDPDGLLLAKDVVPGQYVSSKGVDFYQLVAQPGEVAARLSRQHRAVLLEGTQGAGLSLVHGPWPYVTTADTGAAQLCADAGVPPMALNRVILVARTYPIRVAGNSGPLHGEMSWDTVSRIVGRDLCERTTVTKKVRRVGAWDDRLFREAVTRNAPTDVALTFVDYLDSAVYGATSQDQLTPAVWGFINRIQEAHGVRVTMVGTGGDKFSVVRLTGTPSCSSTMWYTSDGAGRLRRAYPGDAGLDLPVNGEHFVDPGQFCDVMSGIRVEIPDGCWGLIVARSSAVKRGLVTVPNVIDSGFRGELFVRVQNVGKGRVYIEDGARVGQLVVMPYRMVSPAITHRLNDSDRGERGHGSSGA